MATTSNGLNYDSAGFLVGIKNINSTAQNVDDDLKEIIKLLRENKKFDSSSNNVIDLGEVQSNANTIKNLVPKTKIININHSNENILESDTAKPVIQNLSTNEVIVQADHNASSSKDSKDIALENSVNKIVNDLKMVGSNIEVVPEQNKKELEKVNTALEPIEEYAKRTVTPLSSIDKLSSRTAPLSRDQKEFNDDEERALNQILGQSSKNLSLKQMIGSVPLIATAVGGALVLSIKKWWNNKTGTNTESNTSNSPEMKNAKVSPQNKIDSDSQNPKTPQQDISSQNTVPKNTSNDDSGDTNNLVSTTNGNTESNANNSNQVNIDGSSNQAIQNVSNVNLSTNQELQNNSLNIVTGNSANLESGLNVNNIDVEKLTTFTSPILSVYGDSSLTPNYGGNNVITPYMAQNSGSTAPLTDYSEESPINLVNNVNFNIRNQSSTFANSDHIQNIISASNDVPESTPDIISIENNDTQYTANLDRLVLHAVPDTFNT